MVDNRKTMGSNVDLGKTEESEKNCFKEAVARTEEERYNVGTSEEFLNSIITILLSYNKQLNEKGQLK